MPKINTPESGHTGPAANAGWQWLPYTNAAYLKTLKRAISIIDSRIKSHKPCDTAFAALPGARGFVDVWADNSIWISYDPKNNGSDYGATNFVGGKEVTITRYALRMGRWTTAATLIHELAHVNGADASTHAAEETLRHCLLAALEDPNIIGVVERKPGGVMVA
jgi:hypothetical protein